MAIWKAGPALLALSLALLGACAQVGPYVPKALGGAGPAERALDAGVKSYEDGDYKPAASSLQSALDQGLTSKSDQAEAHKYLAFIHCVSRREKQCREEFRKSLEADAKFDLTPAEAGHPTWGPVFRSVKADVAAKGKAK